MPLLPLFEPAEGEAEAEAGEAEAEALADPVLVCLFLPVAEGEAVALGDAVDDCLFSPAQRPLPIALAAPFPWRSGEAEEDAVELDDAEAEALGAAVGEAATLPFAVAEVLATGM